MYLVRGAESGRDMVAVFVWFLEIRAKEWDLGMIELLYGHLNPMHRFRAVKAGMRIKARSSKADCLVVSTDSDRKNHFFSCVATSKGQ